MVRLPSLFFAGVLSLGTLANEADDEETSPMQDSEAIRITTGDNAFQLPRNELAALGDALRRAVEDPEHVSSSGAPVVFTRDLPQSLDEVTYFEETGEIRAGDWILGADADGLFWQNRIVPPDPPQIGLMFIARLVRSEDGWKVPHLAFKRVR